MKFTYPTSKQQSKEEEWKGQKPSKFEGTRKIIHTLDKKDVLLGCDYFNQNPRKRHFKPESSKETVFQPSIKIFKDSYLTSKNKSNNEKEILPQKREEDKMRLEPKKHYYEYREEYIKGLNSKAKHHENKIYVKEELNYLSKIGYLLSKKEFGDMLQNTKTEEDMKNEKIDKYSPENISNTINNINAKVEINDKYKNSEKVQMLLDNNKHIDPLFLVPQVQVLRIEKEKIRKIENKNDYLTQKRENELLEIKNRMELIKKDIDYVKGLGNWDKDYLGR